MEASQPAPTAVSAENKMTELARQFFPDCWIRRFTADDQGSLPTSSSVRVFDAAASCRRIVAPLVEAIGLF